MSAVLLLALAGVWLVVVVMAMSLDRAWKRIAALEAAAAAHEQSVQYHPTRPPDPPGDWVSQSRQRGT